MIYESKVIFTMFDDAKGCDRVIRQRYIVGDAEHFTDAEAQVFEHLTGETNLDVTDLKRSSIREIANTRTSEDERIWIAELQDVFTNDEGEEIYTKYKLAFFATTFDNALAYITKYMQQGYSMELVSLKKSNFVEVIV